VAAQETQAHGSLPAEVRIWRWPADGRPVAVEDWKDIGTKQGRGVWWIDISGPADFSELAPFFDEMRLAQFQRPMLGHVIQGIGPDHPEVEFVDEFDPAVAAAMNVSGGVHFLRAPGLRAHIPIGVSGLPLMAIMPVSFLIGGIWLVTHRAPGTAVTHGQPHPADPLERDDLIRMVKERWRTSVRSPGDVAQLMLRGVAESYPGALREVDRRIRDGELSYLRYLADPEAGGDLDETRARRELLGMTWIVEGAARELAALLRPGAPDTDVWFPILETQIEAAQTHAIVTDALATLRRQRASIRDSLDLIASQQFNLQLEISRDESAQSTRFQQAVGVVAASSSDRR
jgi:hypothetical protein